MMQLLSAGMLVLIWIAAAVVMGIAMNSIVRWIGIRMTVALSIVAVCAAAWFVAGAK